MDYLEGTYKNIKLEDSGIDVILPSVEWFLRRLENNDPFHHLRVNHATIDKYCWKFIPNLPEIPHNLGGVPTSLSNAIEFEKLDEFLTLGKYEDVWKALLTQNSFSYFVEQNTVAEKFKMVNNVQNIERLLEYSNEKISQAMYHVLEKYFGDDEQLS